MTAKGFRTSPAGPWAALVAGVGLVVAQIARNPGVLDRIWAEDGAVFGRQAFEGHIWQQIGRGYAGYLVAPERLLAAPIVSVLPPPAWGPWFAISSMMIAAAAGLAVYRLSGGLLRHWPTRAALGAMVALGPKMRGEWPAVANVGWPLLVALFWIIISVRTDVYSTLLRCGLAVAAMTASGLGLAFVPLAVVVLGGRDHRFVRRFLDRPSMLSSDADRPGLRRADHAVLGAMLVAAALQLLGLATAVAGPRAFRTNVPDIAKLLLVRVFGAVLVGERLVDDAWRSMGMGFALAATAVFLGGLVLLLRTCDRSTRTLAALAVVHAVAIGAASLRTRGTEPFALQPGRFSFDAERYFIIPAFLAVSAVALAVDRGSGQAGAPSRRWPVRSSVFGVFVAVVLIATGFNQRNAEQPSDPWSVSLRRAKAACGTDRALRRVDIPIAPAGIFRLNVPCSRLR